MFKSDLAHKFSERDKSSFFDFTCCIKETLDKFTPLKKRIVSSSPFQTCHSIELKNLDLTNKKSGSGGKNRDHGPIGYKKK